VSTESFTTKNTCKHAGDTCAHVQDVINDIDGVDIVIFLFVHGAGVNAGCGGVEGEGWKGGILTDFLLVESDLI